ncbi:MAG TPA: hypothetical protein VMF61_16185 [Candidatus Acidoferrales bacterium]|nr:hypothetical protein [Candidatus Acidoferrales bacterium]
MSHLGNVPAGVLVETVERLVAKMDESDLAAAFARELSTMPPHAFSAFVESTFEAFRDRGESSEDAVEGAGTTIAGIEARDERAVSAYLDYVRSNGGVLKEATVAFVERHPDLAGTLPPALCSAIAERLARVT